MPRLTSSARQKVMHALQSTKQKQQLAMATTTRSFPVSTTTQHEVHAWQAGRGEHLALSHHTQNLELTVTRSQVKHESTHRRDCRGSTTPHLRREGYIRRLLNLSQPTVTTSQGLHRPSLFRTWKRLRRLVRPMHSLPRGPFTIKPMSARLRSVLTLSWSRLPSHPAAATQLRPQNPVHFASLSVQHGKSSYPIRSFALVMTTMTIIRLSLTAVRRRVSFVLKYPVPGTILQHVERRRMLISLVACEDGSHCYPFLTRLLSETDCWVSGRPCSALRRSGWMG